MCRIRINTEDILANLFSSCKYPVSFTMKEIEKYFRFLSERIPTYVTTDLSEHSVICCIINYPELYQWFRNEDNEIVVRSGKYYPNIDYFLAKYPKGIDYYLQCLTEEFGKDGKLMIQN